MIYLASPYSHSNLGTVIDRYNKTLTVVGKLMKEGLPIFSPIVHCHMVAIKTELPTDFEFWWKYNQHMLDIAEELWVLRLEGWDTSKGVACEMDYAEIIGMEIVYIDD